MTKDEQARHLARQLRYAEDEANDGIGHINKAIDVASACGTNGEAWLNDLAELLRSLADSAESTAQGDDHDEG